MNDDIFPAVIAKLLSHWLIWALGAVAPLAMAFLKKRRGANWPESLRYLLTGLASVVVILAALGVWASARSTELEVRTYLKTQEGVTPDTVEEAIRTWCDRLGYSIKRNDLPDAHFAFEVTLPNATVPVLVYRSKKQDRFLSFQRQLTISPVHRKIYDGLSPAQAEALASAVRLQLATAGAQFSSVSVPLTTIRFSGSIIIENSLTEATFMEKALEVTQASIIAREVIVQTLDSMSLPKP